MDKDFYTDDFEDFLKQKTEQYKIYPSDKSWKNIYNSLHATKRWFTIGGSLLVILTGLFFLDQAVSVTKSSKGLKAINQLAPVAQAEVSPLSSTVDRSTINQAKSSLPANALLKENPTAQLRPVDETMPVARLTRARIDNLQSYALRSTLAMNDKESLININPPLPNGEDAQNISGVDLSAKPITINEENAEKKINWLQELAVIRLTKQLNKRLNLQLYFSPSVSYRRLADNKSMPLANQQNTNTPVSLNTLNIDNYVHHKPSIGAELGTNVLFNAGRNLTLKSGLQLNYSRYSIKAYKSYFEKASIALNSTGPVPDTITTFTSIRNFSGYSAEELQNQYFQVSVPVGAEIKVLGNKQFQFNVAGTIQPTFLLFHDAYLLSSDYMNYAKEPSLMRKWNVHTSVEAFLSYKMGSVRWQIGPQFRYQLMSSYVDRYPIKEYLMEYGLKLGISKTLK